MLQHSEKMPIPPITDRRGNAWKQPDPKTFCFDEHNDFVLMTEDQLKELRDYTYGYITTLYSGKMWREQKNGTWFLYWFDESQAPHVHSMEIILI